MTDYLSLPCRSLLQAQREAGARKVPHPDMPRGRWLLEFGAAEIISQRGSAMAGQWDHFEFTLGSWWASAIINGDHSGLTVAECGELSRFCADVAKRARALGATIGHWDGFSEEQDSMGFTRDEISGLKGDCYKVRYVFCRP